VNRVLLAISLALIGNSALFAAQKEIDPDHSSLTIHVVKSGLLSAAGHEHTVMAPIEDGTIDDSQAAHVSFRVNAARLMGASRRTSERSSAFDAGARPGKFSIP
jgi:hypothetical protein